MKSFLENLMMLALVFSTLAFITAFYLLISHFIFKTSFNLKSFSQLYITVLFLAWILLLFSTAMLFGSGNNDNNLQIILLSNFILFYPIIMSIFMNITGYKIWGINPRYILIFWIITTGFFSVGFNYPRLLINYVKNISKQ